jgi:hypothetical protein
MNLFAKKILENTALCAVLALTVLMLVGTGAALAQVTAPEAYANDGARQNAQGGWTIPYDECSVDVSELGALGEVACLAAGWNWDPQNLTGSSCYYNRPECLARIYFGTPVTAGAPPIDVGPGTYDTPAECAADGLRQWVTAGGCDDGESRNQATCESLSRFWYAPVCRAIFTWDASYGFVGSGTGQYAECAKCHNERHYPKDKPGTHYHGAERSVAETYVMTGHKNMVRPAAPVGNTDPHYIAGAPWKDKTGAVVDNDSSGNLIDWLTGQITISGVPTQLFWIYDWISDAPRSAYDGASYSCARCHTTGYEAAALDETIKQPFEMFGDADPGSGTMTGSFDQFGIMCSRCHGSRPYSATSAFRHHPNEWASGAEVTATCMECHRQEASGAPYDGGLTPGTVLKVGTAHSSVDFVSHAGANQFLNSPHGRFSGTFAQINDPAFYDTHFKNEGEPYPFEGNQGGCVQCHDVHKSTLPEANPAGGAIHEECMECHAKDLSKMIHSFGPGTPFEDIGLNPNSACESCHMPGGKHLFRVTSDADYSTFPIEAFTTPLANANSTTTVEDTFPQVWVDLDMACGQCHGGGTEYKLATGSIAFNTDQLTLTDATGFVVGGRIQIAGAAAGGADFFGYVKAVVGNVVTLAGGAKAGTTVTNAAVTLNPVKNNAAYFNKADLAVKAAGIHNDKPYVTFGYTLTPGNGLQLNVDASFSSCSGDIANCDAFDWNWGDATPNGSGVTASHTYAAAGSYIVTLTVREYGVSEGSKSKSVRVFASDAPPVAGGTDCASIVNLNTWVATLVDNSLDVNGVKQVAVNWGDGGAISSVIDTTAPYSLVGTVFTRTYLNAGSRVIKQTAYDTIGQANVRTCPPVTLATFGLSGNARRLNGTPVASVKVVVKKGAVTVRTVYTNALGDYVVGNLKPGTYNITATKTGLTFPQVYNQPLGPSAPGLNFQATN